MWLTIFNIFISLITILHIVLAEEYYVNSNHECIKNCTYTQCPVINYSICKDICYDDLDCSSEYLCKDKICIPGCREFYVNSEHKCKQKYDCRDSNFCYGCLSREVEERLCENLCYDSIDCKKGEFCNQRKSCEKVNYSKIIGSYIKKTKWFFLQITILVIVIVSISKFLKSKREEIIKKGISFYLVIFTILFLFFSNLIFPYMKKEDYSVYNHFIKYPFYISILFLVLGIIVCLKKVNEIISYVLKSVKFNIHINKYIKYAFISIIFFMLFWFLRTGHSLGDADSIAWNVEHGEKFVNMGEPLTHYAYYLVYNITK
ncbi:MAG: hypothetical protein AABY14_00720, partial [Nanoarchaeota archaeon]